MDNSYPWPAVLYLAGLAFMVAALVRSVCSRRKRARLASAGPGWAEPPEVQKARDIIAAWELEREIAEGDALTAGYLKAQRDIRVTERMPSNVATSVWQKLQHLRD